MASKTSQLDLRIGEVILKIGSVWTEKFKVKVYAIEEKFLSHTGCPKKKATLGSQAPVPHVWIWMLQLPNELKNA